MKKFPVRIATVCVLVLSATFGLAPVSTASTARSLGVLDLRGQEASPQGVWRWYYTNYFYSKDSCNARGYAITTPGHSEYIQGFLAYDCIIRAGEAKWSMKIFE